MRARSITKIEPLEGRRYFAAAHLVNGSLHVAGQPFQANTITVGLSSDHLSVNVNVQWTTHLGVTKTLAKSFPVASVKSAIILGGLKADTVTIDQSNGVFSARTLILGLSGDDVITGGDENDRIEAGAGNDSVSAGAGANTVHGGAGNDTIITSGAGNNRINGGAGNDSITCGSGDDTIVAAGGNDTVDAGGGNDKVFGGPGNDGIAGGPGDDTLWGGRGDDSIDAGPGNDTLGGVIGQNTLLGGSGNDTFVVRSLSANPTNDYNAATDILKTVVAEAATPLI